MQRISNLAIISVIFLSGCALFKPPEPVIQTVVQRVEIPIAVPCSATIPPVPAFSFPTLNETDSLFLKVQSLLSDRELHLGYEALLLGALNSCVK